jgi:hypothetical protein
LFVAPLLPVGFPFSNTPNSNCIGRNGQDNWNPFFHGSGDNSAYNLQYLHVFGLWAWCHGQEAINRTGFCWFGSILSTHSRRR